MRSADLTMLGYDYGYLIEEIAGGLTDKELLNVVVL